MSWHKWRNDATEKNRSEITVDQVKSQEKY